MHSSDKPNPGFFIVLMVTVITAAAANIDCGNKRSVGQTFTSPEEAANALETAARKDDVEGLVRILGAPARDVIVTTDPVADRNARHKFAERASEKKEIISDPRKSDQKIIVAGSDDWPFPVPLVHSDNTWYFDAGQGLDEVVRRRIGENELVAIDICRGYVEAQYAYAAMKLNGSEHYAQKFISSPNTRDGLYWKSDDPDDSSPVAEIIARAETEGYSNKRDPYHGYYFKVLTAQGQHAAGGAMSYMENAVLKKGFALIAWPSDYESTGIMTFFVNQTGIVYQKDLGDKTETIAKAITAYDPDKTWSPLSGSNIPE